jgi:nitrate/nitrite transport system substrate-binding protein
MATPGSPTLTKGSDGVAFGSGRFAQLSAPASQPGSGLDLATLLPSHWVGGVYAKGGPEVRDLTLGFVPLTDCAPLAVAHAKGFFAKHGITSSLGKSTSWTALRDALNDGATHAAQMLFGMAVGAAVGRLGSDQKPLVVPWILSRNGQAITLGAKHRGKIAADAKALRPLAVESRDKGHPLVFGITLPPGTHAMWLRYWLAAGGIQPEAFGDGRVFDPAAPEEYAASFPITSIRK